MSSRSRRSVVMVAAACLLTLSAGMAGCSLPEGADPEPSRTPTEPGASAPPEQDDDPQLIPEGTAEDNLPYFAWVVDQVWASPARSEGRVYIDALVEAGFAREDMQVTEDLSTVNRPAESLQFSVRWGESDCLVGQVGPSTGDPVVAVMDQLAEGRCLVGNTRAIDW